MKIKAGALLRGHLILLVMTLSLPGSLKAGPPSAADSSQPTAIPFHGNFRILARCKTLTVDSLRMNDKDRYSRDSSRIDSLARPLGLKRAHRLYPRDARERTYVLEFPAQAGAEKKLLADLRATGRFDWVEMDGGGYSHGKALAKSSAAVAPNDTYFSRQWSLRNAGGTVYTQTGAPKITSKAGADIKALDAWNLSQGSDKIQDSKDYGYDSWWAAGIHYAVAYAISKIVVVVASMGNDRDSIPQYPAKLPGVIAVGATQPDDNWVHSFPWDTTKGSNFGSHISLCAPGEYIYGLVCGRQCLHPAPGEQSAGFCRSLGREIIS